MKLIIFSSLLLTASLFADVTLYEKSFKVYDYKQKRNGKIKRKIALTQKTLKDFTSKNSFDGKYFKVVAGKSNDPISFDDNNDELITKAATVYFHLSKARAFYKSINIPGAQLDEKITVRVEHNRQFSETLQFKGDKFYQYNGAKTIDSSENLNSHEHLHWGKEIWFFKYKRIKRNTGIKQISRATNSRRFKNALAGGLVFNELTQLGHTIGQGQLSYLSFEKHLLSMFWAVGLVEFFPKVFTLASQFKAPYGLDTALVPAIIHHEYGHIALSHIFGHKSETHLIEGYPNYFASLISGRIKFGGNQKGIIAGNRAKNGLSKKSYSLTEEELKQAAFGSFTFSLLLSIHNGMGEEGQAILINALKYIDRESDLKTDFSRALYLSIDDISKDPRSSKLRLSQILNEKGL